MTKDDALAILRGVAKYLIAGNEISYSEKLMLALDVAIEALEAQKMKYTFGNDGFSLENAYHDCKMVFDGITDDRSYQEADTGLILYYANEIIYALHKALKEVKKPNEDVPDINVGDMISRQDAIDAHCELCGDKDTCSGDICPDVEVFQLLPSVQPDDRLAKIANLVEGTIDHFDLDDAMDLLYQIKDVLK